MQSKPTVAFLGPFGTYSHQAAHEYFVDKVRLIERDTISDVFSSLIEEADFGVVPQENTIYGSVVETYDKLRTVELGFVRGEVVLPVQHCLLVRKGVQLSDIDCVMSHEQALGQCQGFIARTFPHARTVKTSSTAAAAEAIANSPGSKTAAICSKICLQMFKVLSLLEEGIQDESSNYTRFYILAKDTVTLPPSRGSTNPGKGALVRIQCPSSLTRIAAAITTIGIDVSRIDRRPALNRHPFDDVYFVELRDNQTTKLSWSEQVQEAVERVRATGGEVKRLGLW